MCEVSLAEGMTQLQRRRGSAAFPLSPPSQLSNQEEEVAAPVEISQSSSSEQGSVIPSDQGDTIMHYISRSFYVLLVMHFLERVYVFYGTHIESRFCDPHVVILLD
jgi:hypothetical protein